MKAVIQKVSGAEIIIDGKLVSSINKGIVIFLGIELMTMIMIYIG